MINILAYDADAETGAFGFGWVMIAIVMIVMTMIIKFDARTVELETKGVERKLFVSPSFRSHAASQEACKG